MPTQYIKRTATTYPATPGRATAAPIYVDSDDNILKMIPAGSGTTEVQVIDASSVQTMTNKTLTTPTISGVVTNLNPQVTGDASSGVVVAKTMSFVEDATSVSHTGTVVIPAGATLLDILVSNAAYWGAASASMTIGDTASANGYLTASDLKATDFVPGEVFSVSGSTGNWAGKNGAYLVAATGRRGPASTNFGTQYISASTISVVITVGTPGSTIGRTFVTVFYAVGQAVTIVKA
jgi:hypothetical protein